MQYVAFGRRYPSTQSEGAVYSVCLLRPFSERRRLLEERGADFKYRPCLADKGVQSLLQFACVACCPIGFHL